MIVVGDCLSVLSAMPNESVHCCVTSPPYWGLRSYGGDPGMIGLELTLDEHIERLVEVFAQVRRVLRQDGTLWLNYGDAYAANTKGSGGASKKQDSNAGSRYGATKLSMSGFKPKDLMMMPARVALALQDDGADKAACQAIGRAIAEIEAAYDPDLEQPPDKVLAVLERLEAEYMEARGDAWWLRSEIVWHKPNPMPESVTDRPTSAHEKLFLFSRAPRYYYDADAVRVGNQRHKKHGITLREYGVIEGEKPKTEEYTVGANLRNVWEIPTHAVKQAHFATFPPALVEPCIKAGTSQKGVCGECGAPWERMVEKTYHQREDMTYIRQYGGNGELDDSSGWNGTADLRKKTQTLGWQPTCTCNADRVPAVILDPFGGAGTVALVAQRLNRKALCIEINHEYARMAQERCEKDLPITRRSNRQDPNDFKLEFSPA